MDTLDSSTMASAESVADFLGANTASKTAKSGTMPAADASSRPQRDSGSVMITPIVSDSLSCFSWTNAHRCHQPPPASGSTTRVG